MKWIDLLYYIPTVVGVVVAVFCPTLYARFKAARRAADQVEAAADLVVEANAAKTEAEAELDLTKTMHAAVDAAEQAYCVFDEMAKSKGLTCGALKRESVLAKLQAYALEKGYTFDAEAWGAAIDEFVAATKRINFKK